MFNPNDNNNNNNRKKRGRDGGSDNDNQNKRRNLSVSPINSDGGGGMVAYFNDHIEKMNHLMAENNKLKSLNNRLSLQNTEMRRSLSRQGGEMGRLRAALENCQRENRVLVDTIARIRNMPPGHVIAYLRNASNKQDGDGDSSMGRILNLDKLHF